MPQVVSIAFRKLGKTYFFDPNDIALSVGDNVMVSTVSGEEYAQVVGPVLAISQDPVSQPLKKVIRKAGPDDDRRHADNLLLQTEARRTAQQKAAAQGLDMRIVEAQVAFDGSKITFHFSSENRIDFRQLVKDLAAVFKRRIELRQVGIRDKAKMVGGLGTCGQRLCCTVFLNDLDPVSIRMAKDQDLPLNPQKISGVCGRLMCCLRYEVEAYRDFKKRAPKRGKHVEACEGVCGDVVSMDAIREKVTLRDENGNRVTVPLADIKPECGCGHCGQKKKDS